MTQSMKSLQETLKDTGLPLAEFLRRQVMKGKVIAKYEIVADVPELKKLVAEFGKIGSNLNQIARYSIRAVFIHRKCKIHSAMYR